MMRTPLCALMLAVAAGGGADAAPLNYVDSGIFVPVTALQYGGFIAHGGVQTHTYLAPTYGECQALLQQSIDQHIADAAGHFGWGHPSSYTYQPCSLRSAFQMFAPQDSDEDAVTVTITIPARYSREVGELRRRYRYDQYLADYERLFPAK